MASHYGRVFRDSNGAVLTGLDVDLYTTGTSTKAYDLTESASTPGYYYNDAVSIGNYDIYVDSSLKYSNVFVGDNKLKSIADKFNTSAELGTSGIQDNAVTPSKTSFLEDPD